jgi:hypothetical protein
MYRHISVIIFCLFLCGLLRAEQLRPETTAAFQLYVEGSEARMSDELKRGTFLYIDGLPDNERAAAYRRLLSGEIAARAVGAGGRTPVSVPGGLIHHWAGIVFIPGVNLERTLAFLQDYDHQSRFYAPDVQQSRLLHRDGNNFTVFLRLRKSKVVTVILNTEYDVTYSSLDINRASSLSLSTRIAEVENAGQPEESEKPVGNDSGFLWRLNSYWRFWQKDGGTYVQLEAISLTRDVPAGLGWLINPFIQSIPQGSLRFTLERTRDGLTQR